MTEIQEKSIFVRVSDRFDLGTGHYLSPGGRGTEDFRGDHLIFRKTKGGITENVGRIQRGATQICLENEDMEGGGGGLRKSSTVIRGNHFSEVTFKGGIG